MHSRVPASILLGIVMVISGLVGWGLIPTGPGPSGSDTSGTASVGASHALTSPASSVSPSTRPTAPRIEPGTSDSCPSLESVSNNPGYGTFVRHVQSIARSAVSSGLPPADLHLPYAGPIADQIVNGVPMAGSLLTDECDLGSPTPSQTAPTGVSYDGQTDVGGLKNVTLDSNSVAGALTVNSPTQNFYPGSGTPTVWGAQENVVLPNVTLFGRQCPTEPCAQNGTGNYAFWVQNVLSYDSRNDSLYFVDDTWNFTSDYSEMFNSSLVRWSPNGGNYTGVWVAFSQYYYLRPPFTVTMYVNTSVDPAGDQVLWYNYSIQTPARFIGNGNYDYLVFQSQTKGHRLSLRPPDFEASATSYHLVPEEFEFDAFIGADDGSNQLMLGANATMTVQYCDLVPFCTSSHFAYANVPAAVDFGSETGEQAIGIAVGYVGTTAYLSAGPLIYHGLWNMSAMPDAHPGVTKVVNSIHVVGDPEGPLSTQPYVFVFFENRADKGQGFQWAPDGSSWYLQPGTYRYAVLLADYDEARGTLVVGTSPTTLAVTLRYNATMGVYTPLWAFGNGELAGISSTGDGTIHQPYVPFNNPTTAPSGFIPGDLSAYFFSLNDYAYPSFAGVLFSGTDAYVDLNAPPAFSVPAGGGVNFNLGLEFYETQHITLSHDSDVLGWQAWSEISFYYNVPASQNPVPESEVSFWYSQDSLILSNDFVGTLPIPGFVAPDGLVLYGGTNNVVWGNNFTDPPGTSVGVDGPYAGLGLGEGGDLIYNNNFTVDNPVVYLPYNWPNVADCLPQTLGPCAYDVDHNSWYYNDAANVVGNTWNVRPQPAVDVVHVINGFPLSGNVLGPDVTTQGGNYYWNYGTSPNNYSTLPYVSRFYYSDWSVIYPLGCGSIEAPAAPCGTPPPIVGAYEDGIATGGDFAPYGPTVVFVETGLPAGTPWHVTLDGVQYGSDASRISFSVEFGTYLYTVGASGWHADPKSGSVLASGIVFVHVSFVRGHGHAGSAELPPLPAAARIRR